MTKNRKNFTAGMGRWKLCLVAAAILLSLLAGCSDSDTSARPPQPDTPVRIAWAGEEQVVVSDYQKESIQFRDRQTLELQRSLVIKGHPLAIGYASGKIFVGNETTQCVEVYDSTSGGKLYTLGNGPGSIPVPNDLTIDEASGRVFVADSSNKRIAVFSLDGPLLSIITDPALIQPTSVVLDAAGEHLYVGNLGNEGFAPNNYGGNVLVFTVAGQFERSIVGDFTHPKGLTVDAAGHLYLVEALLAQVLVFDVITGRELTRLGVEPTYAGQHKMPFAAIFDGRSQQILVTDYLLGKIETYAVPEVN